MKVTLSFPCRYQHLPYGCREGVVGRKSREKRETAWAKKERTFLGFGFAMSPSGKMREIPGMEENEWVVERGTFLPEEALLRISYPSSRRSLSIEDGRCTTRKPFRSRSPSQVLGIIDSGKQAIAQARQSLA